MMCKSGMPGLATGGGERVSLAGQEEDGRETREKNNKRNPLFVVDVLLEKGGCARCRGVDEASRS